MKRGMRVLPALVLCLGVLCGATADGEVYREPLCTPQEVDLSGVRQEGGRLVGEVRLPEGLARGRILVDCPVPGDFPREQRQKLQVRYQPIEEKELGKALQALEQEARGGRFESRRWAGQTFAQFTLERDLPRYYFWGALMEAAASRDSAYQREYDQAKDLLRALIQELGAEACEGLLHANRLDEEHFYPYSDREYSTSLQIRERAVADFRQGEEQDGRTERNLTLVSGMYEIQGLPVMFQYRIPHGDSWETGVSAFHGAVRDDGRLRHLEVEGLPVVTGAEPMAMPQRSWRELLAGTIANGWCVSNTSFEDATYEDRQGSPVTRRASYAVISGLHPCWVGMEGATLEPGWYMNIEERVAMDHSLLAPWSSYGDAETLTCIQ